MWKQIVNLYFGASDKHIDESVMSFFSTVIAKNGLSPHGVTNPAECNWYLHRSENPKSKIRRNLKELKPFVPSIENMLTVM